MSERAAASRSTVVGTDTQGDGPTLSDGKLAGYGVLLLVWAAIVSSTVGSAT